MGLRIKSTRQFGHKIATLMAVFALVAQPMYGFVASQVSAAPGPVGLAVFSADTTCVAGKVQFDITAKNEHVNYATANYETSTGHTGQFYEVAPGEEVSASITTGLSTVDAGKVVFTVPVVATGGTYEYETEYSMADCKPVFSSTTPSGNVYKSSVRQEISATVTSSGADNPIESVKWTLRGVTNGIVRTSDKTNPSFVNTSGNVWAANYETVNIPVGDYTITFEAIDKAGNKTTTPAKHVGLVVPSDQIYRLADDGTTPEEYFTTIQDAIDDNNPIGGVTQTGDTIVLPAGDYIGNLNVNKGLTIKGAGDATNINGKISINATSDVTLADFDLAYDSVAVKVPSAVSLDSLTLNNLNIAADKAIFIADSKTIQSTIGELNITNSTINSNYPFYTDHSIGKLTITGNIFNIVNGNRGVVLNKQLPNAVVDISNNTFNASTGADLDTMNFVKYEPANSPILTIVKINNSFTDDGDAVATKISDDNKAIVVGEEAVDPNGNHALNSVSGTIYRDKKLNDCSGRTNCLDRAEGLADWQVNIYKEDAAGNWGEALRSATTNTDGVFSLGSFQEAGRYHVCEVLKAGWTQTKQTWSGSGFLVKTDNKSPNVADEGPYCATMNYDDTADKSWKMNIGNVDVEKPTGEATYHGGNAIDGIRYLQSINDFTFDGSFEDNYQLRDTSFPVWKVNSEFKNRTLYCGNWNNTSTTVGLSGASDSFTGKSVKDCGPAKAWEDGYYQLNHRVYDTTGNFGSFNTSVENFVIDSIAPVVTLHGLEDGKDYQGPVDIVASISDANLKNYYLTVVRDGNPAYTNKNTSEFSNLIIKTLAEEGDYTVKLEARDLANNKDDRSVKTVSFSIDNTAPLVDNVGYDVFEGVPAIYGTVDDIDSTVWVQFGGVTTEADGVFEDPETGLFVWVMTLSQALAPGNYNVNAWADDEAGNSSATTPAVYAFTVPAPARDRTPNRGTTTTAVEPADDGGTSSDSENLSSLLNPGIVAFLDEQAEEEGEVLAEEDNAQANNTENGEVLADEDAADDGCAKFLGLCWYWWIPIVGAVLVVGWILRGMLREDDELPPARRQ